MNLKEQKFKKKIQKDIEIPEVVKNKAEVAFNEIRKIKVEESRRTRLKFKKIILGVGSVAAVLVVLIIFGMSNPVWASEIPLIGHIFEKFQNDYSYAGDYSSVAQNLEENIENENAENEEVTTPKYSKTVDGITMTLSEIYCNEQAIYITFTLKSKEPYPIADIKLEYESNQPVIALRTIESYEFNEEEHHYVYYLEGEFIDEYTYAGIVRLDLFRRTRIVSQEANDEYNKAYNLAIEEGKDPMDESISLDVKRIDLPEEFKLNLGIEQIVAMKANPDIWDSGYTEEELEDMSDEEWRKVMNSKPAEWNCWPNEHEMFWWDGIWNFDLDVKVDTTRTKTFEVNSSNENGIGIESVVITPFELKLNQLNQNSTNAGYPIVLDASGKMLPYGNSSYTSEYAIHDIDISMIDVYLCDYLEYVDEIAGYENDKNFKDILEEKALYHTTIETGIENIQ